MDPSPDRRDSRRIFLGPDHSIHFLLKGHAFHEIRITNVSLGGCLAMAPLSDRSLFTQGAILEQLGFDHPDLPRGPITAQIRYAFGTPSEQPGLEFIGIGISFVAMSQEIRERLSVFMEAMLEI